MTKQALNRLYVCSPIHQECCKRMAEVMESESLTRCKMDSDLDGSGTVLNPAVGAMTAEYWGGDSVYDALEAQVTKKMSHGFQVQGSYTWGKISTRARPISAGLPSASDFGESSKRFLF